jgi:hypothetical protein
MSNHSLEKNLPESEKTKTEDNRKTVRWLRSL